MKADNAEFERIVTEYAPVMYRAALAVTGSEAAAEDAVGDAVLRAWQRLGSLREPSAARAWLVKIAVNCARGQLRRSPRRSRGRSGSCGTRWRGFPPSGGSW